MRNRLLLVVVCGSALAVTAGAIVEHAPEVLSASVAQAKKRQKTQDVDRNSITSEAKHVRDWNGGSLYQIGGLDLVVLNGTYKEMGRQYGHLVKDKLIVSRDRWKKVFVESGTLSWETILEVLGRPVYTGAPQTLKQLYQGISETSGLPLEETVMLDNWIPLAVLGRRSGCSSFVAWGSKTVDGTAYMGRNLDFPLFARDLMAEAGVITVLNPVGGEFGLAGVGAAGVVTGFNDMMNSAGLYAEFNNGVGSIEPVWYSNRLDILAVLAQTLHSYSTIDELKMVFSTVKSSYPMILGVSEPYRGVHIEMSPEKYVAEATGDSSLRANQFTHPSWGIPMIPGATGWYTTTRMEAWEKAITATGAERFDETVFMEVMNAPMWAADNTLTGTGFSVFEPAGGAAGGAEGGDVTVLQVITHAAERTWWLRIPTHTGWLKVDFREYFDNPRPPDANQPSARGRRGRR